MEIRPIKKSEWEKLRAFNEAEYRPGHILTNKIYYDWQFDNFTNSDKGSYSTLGLFDKSGELAGTFGMFALPFNFFGKTLMGNCLANLIVRKDLRNLGYGYLLLEKAAALYDLAIDHTINDAAWPMFMRAGWQGENLKRFLYVITPKNALYELPAAGPTKVSENGWKFELVSVFDDRTHEFSKRVKARYPITVERSADYLNWRYAKNPLVKYQIFVAKDGEKIKALVVLRIEEVKREKPIEASPHTKRGSKPSLQDFSNPRYGVGVKVGRIIDFVADAAAEEFALGEITEYCRRNRIDFIDYFLSGDFHLTALRKVGFVGGDEPPYDALPILFNPVSFKRTHLNFAVKAKQATSLSDWYTTKGSGDQDRPY